MATASEPTEAVEKVGEEVTEAMDQIGEETAEAMEQVREDTAEAIEQVGEETTETKELGGEKPNEAMEQQIGEEQEDSLRSALPLGMVKRIIRADRDIKKVTSEAAAMLITAATELFVSSLTAGAHAAAAQRGRRRGARRLVRTDPPLISFSTAYPPTRRLLTPAPLLVPDSLPAAAAALVGTQSRCHVGPAASTASSRRSPSCLPLCMFSSECDVQHDKAMKSCN